MHSCIEALVEGMAFILSLQVRMLDAKTNVLHLHYMPLWMVINDINKMHTWR